MLRVVCVCKISPLMLQFLNVLQDPVEIELAEAQSRDLCGGNDLCFPWYTMLLVPGSRLLLRDHKSFYLLLHFVKVSRNLGALNLRGERERERARRGQRLFSSVLKQGKNA